MSMYAMTSPPACGQHRVQHPVDPARGTTSQRGSAASSHLLFTRPQCGIPDFYRELGDLFGVQLSPHNRWAGARVLRACWQDHIAAALLRPVLFVDEAQETKPVVLNELRLLCAAALDARALLTVVL